jgi:hypothetical protein
MMPKRRPLVTQHLENVSREALERYQGILRAYIRNRQGVYVLYRRGKLYYIGLAGDLRKRLGAHLRDHHKESWDRFSVYLTIGVDHMKELESLILRIAIPHGNRVKGSFAKSENLLPKLKRDLRRSSDEELARLLGALAKSHPVKVSPKRKVQKPLAGRPPVLAGYFDKPIELRASHKGEKLRARVRRDGSVTFRGKSYNSPSVAGAAAVRRISCNGWTFWKYERSPGDWVFLDTLRKR